MSVPRSRRSPTRRPWPARRHLPSRRTLVPLVAGCKSCLVVCPLSSRVRDGVVEVRDEAALSVVTLWRDLKEARMLMGAILYTSIQIGLSSGYLISRIQFRIASSRPDKSQCWLPEFGVRPLYFAPNSPYNPIKRSYRVNEVVSTKLTCRCIEMSWRVSISVLTILQSLNCCCVTDKAQERAMIG